MRVISIHLENFGSYKTLDFDFQNQGLTLIQGPTGSGKSTLMDAVPWVLFGVTAKDGKADEVRSWAASEPTLGVVVLDTGLTVTRIRGRQNDLYFRTGTEAEPTRGKDIQDTQRLINNLLGVDHNLYLSGAYYHEFSQTAQFFTTSAKNRRQICEQIVDLSLAKNLQEKTKERIKEIQNNIKELHYKSETLKSHIKLLQQHQANESTKAEKWQAGHAKTIQYVASLYDKFEAGRKKVVTNECRSCGTVLAEPKEIYDDSPNPHLERLAELEREENPHNGSIKDFSKEIAEKQAELIDISADDDKITTEYSDLEVLTGVIEAFRSDLISNTISYIQDNTNDLLTKYFDAELQVSFSAGAADRLDVEIAKDGNDASFTQLSKGQRQLLKLCFATSVMLAVQNHSGVKFEEIFLDEALDGLDENLKTKAYRFLEDLALIYSSVFVVEHSEGLKAMFPRSYKISLINGESQIALIE